MNKRQESLGSLENNLVVYAQQMLAESLNAPNPAVLQAVRALWADLHALENREMKDEEKGTGQSLKNLSKLAMQLEKEDDDG